MYSVVHIAKTNNNRQRHSSAGKWGNNEKSKLSDMDQGEQGEQNERPNQKDIESTGMESKDSGRLRCSYVER
jgi:hypothetical protein